MKEEVIVIRIYGNSFVDASEDIFKGFKVDLTIVLF